MCVPVDIVSLCYRLDKISASLSNLRHQFYARIRGVHLIVPLRIIHTTHNPSFDPSSFDQSINIARFFPPIGKLFSSITSSTLKNLKGESRRSKSPRQENPWFLFAPLYVSRMSGNREETILSKRKNLSTSSSISILSLSSSYNLIDQRKKCNWTSEIMSR